jgi:outer membrane protein
VRILSNKKKYKGERMAYFKLLSFSLCVLFFTSSCSYPLSFLFNKEALPKELGDIWVPKKKSIRSTNRINYVEPIDPNTLQGPLSLAQVVDFSLRNNPNTALSWANILGSIADLGLARKDFWPTVSVSGNIQRQMQDSVFSLQADATMWLTLGGVQGTVSYTIWDFGSRFAKSESALQALYAMSYAYNQELQTVIQSVTNNFYSLLYNNAALLDRERDVADSRILLDAVEKKLSLGIANITDLVQAKTSYLSARVNLVTQKDNAENALAALAQNMGMAANQRFETQNFPSELPGREFLCQNEAFIQLALQNRPELIQYKSEVLSKRAALTFSRLDPLPKVSGSVELDYTAYNGFPNALSYTGMFQVNFPFFDGFYYRNKVREAKAELKKAVANLKLAQDNILGEVTTYYNNYKNAVEKIEFTQEYLDAAFDEFEVTLGNYKAGTGNILDVLQALTSLANARTQFTLSVQDLFTSLTNLAYATGSLITPKDHSSWQDIYQFNPETPR